MKAFLYDNDQLDIPEIRNKIRSFFDGKDYQPSEKLIDDIIQQFWFHDTYNNLISYPYYLDHLIDYLNTKQQTHFNRPDFYRFLFSTLISSSFSKKDQVQATHILYQIGVLFEQRQALEIEIEEYEKFLKEIDAPKGWFAPEWFVKQKLGKIEKREKKSFFVLSHHTISEGLAALFIQGQSDPLDAFKHYLIFREGKFEALIPSWFGVLRFLIENDQNDQILDWLIRWIVEHPDDLNESLSDTLCNLHRSIKNEYQQRIFDLVYRIYFDRAVWIPVWTRTGLGKYVDKPRYEQLKQDLNTGNSETEKMVHTGNIVAIVHSMIESQSPLLADKEKVYWKKKFIEYANRNSSENGVLQRHSLHALASFHDEGIISQVSQNYDNPDSLVRDAFMDFCIETDPNSKTTIDYLIKGVAEDKTIYARLGIDKITDKKALQYFLGQIVSNKQFLKEYTEYRTIFEKDPAEPHLISNLSQVLDKETAHLILQVVYAILEHDEIYQMGNSGLLRELIMLVDSFDNNTLFNIIDFVSVLSDGRQNRIFLENRSILSDLITSDNWEKYVKKSEALAARQRLGPIYNQKGTSKNEIYENAVEKGYITELPAQPTYEIEQKKREQSTYQEFYQQLNRGEKRYDPNVFEYYLKNKKIIKQLWKKEDKQRLIELAVKEGIERINPREFRVEILGDKESSREFSWSAPAAYFGFILEVIQEFKPKLLREHIQKLIDYIPFSFSHDIFPLLEKILPLPNTVDFTYLNETMLNQSADIRYLVPSTYMYFVSEMAERGFEIDGAREVLLSFVHDEKISAYDRRSALEKLKFFISSDDAAIKHQLQAITGALNSQDDEARHLAYVANELLITVYKDDDAIEWRFKKIEEPIHLVREEGSYTPSAEQLEIDFMQFAKPLIELKDQRYLHHFLGLLQKSIDLAEDAHENNLWEYVQYLWKIVFSYAEGLVAISSIHTYKAVKAFVDSNAKQSNSNWLYSNVEALRSKFVNKSTKTRISKDIVSVHSSFTTIKQLSSSNEKEIGKDDSLSIETAKKSYVKPNVFIIHAAWDHPLPNEREFIDLLYNELSERDLNPWVDFKDSNNHRKMRLDHINSAHFAVIVCSPRFLERIKPLYSDILDEIDKMIDTRNRLQYNTLIPIIFGISIKDFSTKTPFSNGSNRIDVQYDVNHSNIEEMVIIAASKICAHIEKEKNKWS